MGEVGSDGWLWGPRGPGANAIQLVGEAMSWALWWEGLSPGAADISGGLMAADLLVGGAGSLPS